MRAATYDFLVLGAGAAGCAAAHALATAHPGATVGLVEEGGRHHSPAVMRVPALQPFIPAARGAQPFLRRVQGVPEENLGGRSLEYVRGRGLGGSTLCNDMRYRCGTAADYDAWGQPAWRWEAISPVFAALTQNSRGDRRAGGPLPVTDADRSNTDSFLNVRFFEACEAAGIPAARDFNDGVSDGFSSFQSLIRRGSRVDVFDALVEQRRHLTPNLRLLTGTRADRIVFDGTRAVGVDVTGGEHPRLACGRVVVCLGAIESPALLQRSGVGAGGGVLDLPAVGENLIQGCAADLVFRARTNMAEGTSKSLSWRNAPYLWRQWREYREDGTGVFATLAEAGAFVRSEPALPHPDLSLVFYRTPQVGWRRPLRPMMDGMTVRVAHHYPLSRGAVWFDPATQRPAVRSGLLSEKADVMRMDEGVKWVGLLLSHETTLKSVYHRDHAENHVSPFWSLSTAVVHPPYGIRTQRDTAMFLAQYAEGSGDLFGTCAMGAVVGADLAVQGVDGVSVADASVVPAPTVASGAIVGAAIGARIAEFI